MEGNLRFKKIRLALQLEGNLPFLLCFTLYSRAISKYKPPGCLYLEGLIHGGAYCRNFTVSLWGYSHVVHIGGLHVTS